MYISKLELKNFKRFTDLTLDLTQLPKPPKLVLLVGVNGSGKSSVFDAFEYISTMPKGINTKDSPNNYVRKSQSDLVSVILTYNDNKTTQRSADGNTTKQIADGLTPVNFYGRSSFRHIPRLSTKKAGEYNIATDDDRPRFYIEKDNRFELDIEIITQKILLEVFDGEKFDNNKLKEKYLLPLNQSIKRIFSSSTAPSIELVRIIPAVGSQPADIRFRKGKSEIHYDLLSAGEKEVFNILINLFIRREYFNDTVYYIDELDLHLNTALQYSLLKEITENWLPENCQLWTASHSLGFIDYARESEHAAIIDFDSLDFDVPHTLYPEAKQSLQVFDVAVPQDTLLRLFKGKQIVFCENQNDQYYNSLGDENLLFVGVKDKSQVWYSAKSNKGSFALMDRDFISDTEVAQIRQKFPNLFFTHYYAFENYLYHPDNLAEALGATFDKAAHTAEIIRQKNQAKSRILVKLTDNRRSYTILKEAEIKIAEVEEIMAALDSDELERFYAYFDMKTLFDKQHLGKFNHKLTYANLTQTKFFKNNVLSLFK